MNISVLEMFTFLNESSTRKKRTYNHTFSENKIINYLEYLKNKYGSDNSEVIRLYQLYGRLPNLYNQKSIINAKLRNLKSDLDDKYYYSDKDPTENELNDVKKIKKQIMIIDERIERIYDELYEGIRKLEWYKYWG